jgi:type IX secretion system PorP/SprF family membrane protein
LKQHLLYTFCALAIGLMSHAQDLHFSQFNQNPALVNPALTGAVGLRASAGYRNQWKSIDVPYKTYGASFEMRTPPFGGKVKREGSFGSKNPEARMGNFGAGISVYKDKTGDGKMNLTQANLSLAAFIPTGEKSFLSLGVQGSYVQRQLDNAQLIFPDQYNGLGYSSSLPSGENFAAQKFTNIDLAAGVLWSFNDEERRIRDHKQVKASIGFSAYHLLQPKLKYLQGSSDVTAFKYVGHGDFLISIQNSKLAIAPSYLVQLQKTSMEILAGAMIKYYTLNDTKYTGYVRHSSVGFGAYYRNQDAAILYGLLEWQEQYAIGISYDLNVSKLSKASNMRGGLELTLRYTAANNFLYQKVK